MLSDLEANEDEEISFAPNFEEPHVRQVTSVIAACIDENHQIMKEMLGLIKGNYDAPVTEEDYVLDLQSCMIDNLEMLANGLSVTVLPSIFPRSATRSANRL